MDTAPVNALPATSLSPRDVSGVEPDWALVDGVGALRPPSVAAVRHTVERAAKRLVDVTGAGTALLLLAPLIVAVALLVRYDSPGPVLFRQRRLGRYGRPFWILKFRTMRADAEQRLAELENHNEAARGVLFKMRDDPRVTSLGRFLRRTNLDELPQLWNVLKGEMSLVGPRPFQMRDCERLRAVDPFAFSRRLEVPPGLTGAWQVGRSCPTDSEHLLDLDLDYVDRWSLGYDLVLIYRTLFILFRGFLPNR